MDDPKFSDETQIVLSIQSGLSALCVDRPRAQPGMFSDVIDRRVAMELAKLDAGL